MQVIERVDLTGRTAVVTGGSSGIGVETTRALAAAGADVVIAVRDPDAGARASEEINAALGARRVSAAQLDLTDLESVRRFASSWKQPLSILINNAGIMACPLAYTRDGFEMQLATNHVGHFLLSALLTPALVAGAPARVISLSSSAHMHGDIDFEDPHFRGRPYTPFAAYAQSKTANALFAVGYDRRHGNSGVHAFAVMPGVIETRLTRYLTPELAAQVGLRRSEGSTFSSAAIRYKTPEQGAATSVWAATAAELGGQGGLYLHDCRVARPHTAEMPRGEGVQPHALDPDRAARLWSLSERWVSLE